jgi:hypothetical protein
VRRILSFELKFARNKLLIRKHESRVFEALTPIILLEIWAPTLSAYAKGLVGGRLLDVMVIPSINDKILRTENVKTSLASTIDANDKNHCIQKLHAILPSKSLSRWAPPLSYYSLNLRVAPSVCAPCNHRTGQQKRKFQPQPPFITHLHHRSYRHPAVDMLV